MSFREVLKFPAWVTVLCTVDSLTAISLFPISGYVTLRDFFFSLCKHYALILYMWSNDLKWKKQMDQRLKFITFMLLCHGYIELIIKLHLVKYNKLECSLLKVYIFYIRNAML